MQLLGTTNQLLGPKNSRNLLRQNKNLFGHKNHATSWGEKNQVIL